MTAGTDERFARTTTGAVCDALMRRGLRQFMAARIRQVGERRLIGRALTVERPRLDLAPRGAARPNSMFLDLIADGAPGTVLVMVGPSVVEASLWGGLLAAAAVNRGFGGVVCDGPLRDADEIIAAGCPAFATGSIPAGAAGILTLGAIGAPLLCGGIVVHPGDLVFGDHNGVVVIPAGIEDAVLDEAVAIEASDQEAVARLRAGADLRATMRALGRG